MASGPDPNRHFGTDRENQAEEVSAGGGLGNPRSTRLGLSSWAVAGVAVVILFAVLALLF